MAFEQLDIMLWLYSALKEYAHKNKTAITKISYDGDHKSSEMIVDVRDDLHHSRTKGLKPQSFVISSTAIREIPYDG